MSIPGLLFADDPVITSQVSAGSAGRAKTSRKPARGMEDVAECGKVRYRDIFIE